MVTIHAGTYREYLDPQRGGTSDKNRIVYKNFENDKVYVKGSEQINTWSRVGDGVWKVVLPNSFFGDYNPYLLNVAGDFQLYGQQYHRGDVYINNISLNERLNQDEVSKDVYTWNAEGEKDTIVITANFGKFNPNTELAEINVREKIFFPSKKPHTLEVTNRQPLFNCYNKIYNNIFSGLKVKRKVFTDESKGNSIDNNVYLSGLQPLFERENFARSDSDPNFKIISTPSGATIRFNIDNSPFGLNATYVNQKAIGIVPLTGQSIEDKNGNPIIVNTDFYGKKRNSKNPLPGPLSNLVLGNNRVSWSTHMTSTGVHREQPQYNLEISVKGNGHVNASSGSLTINTQFLLIPTPGEGWVFAQWEGDIMSDSRIANLQMNSNKKIVAKFVRKGRIIFFKKIFNTRCCRG